MLARFSRANRVTKLACCAALALSACQSKSGDDDSSSASSASASATTGGSANGGAGTAAMGGALGGTTALGGSTAMGGTTALGGSTATGGTDTSGSAGTTRGSAGTADGSAGTTSGSVGGASGSAGSPAGGSGGQADPCATALFCDDFESYTTAPSGKWTVRASTGAVTIDTTNHVSGTKSAKFTTTSAGSASAMIRLQDASIFPVDGNVFYGRMLFRVESVPTASVHWTLLDGLGTVPGQTYHALYRYGGQQPVTTGSTFVGSQMMANYETPDWYSDKSTPGSDCWHHSNQRVIPVATWTCIEWEFDGPNNGMQMWLDGAAAEDLTILGHGDGCVNAANDYPWTAPTFASVDLGWESYQQDDPRTAYIDDVVISKTKIGCP